MVLSNSKCMQTRIQNSRILIQCLQKLFQYSTVHSNRIESNSIIRNRLLLQLFISEMIHAKQWHYSLQRLPVASFYTHSTRRNPRDSSSSNSTFRRQGALRFILHTEGKEIFYPVYQALQPQDLPQAFQFYKGIPVIHDIPASQALLHVPAPSSTIQCLPVLSSVSRDSTRSSIPSIRMQILHTDWFPPETPLSTSRRQYKTFYKHYILQRKGDVAILVICLTYSPE